MDTASRAIAIVGMGAILPDATSPAEFWANLQNGRDSIGEVPPERWNSAFYYDPDPHAPDKSYSKIGGWVRDSGWDPAKWRLPIPPRVADAMDESQKWAIACTRQALEDYGYPERPLDGARTAVILGNAMGGERHYLTALRVYFPDFAHELENVSSFAALPDALRREVCAELQRLVGNRLPAITEDSMPGELSNCLAGRIANLFNLRGPNYAVDAACASAMAAIHDAVEGLAAHEFDLAISGALDRNMGPSTFVKFCKIGALSATGTRPYAESADGFVMGEGGAVFLLKRLADAERDRDKIYAVLRGVAGSSDGKGKGITAPNPIGQKLCIERAWQAAGLSPATASFIEGHGTSTRVGDAVEIESLAAALHEFNLPPGSIALGSVKSNFGHLKAAAGAAGMLKAVLALHHKMLPPSLHCDHPNSALQSNGSPLYVNRSAKPLEPANGTPLRAGVSAFGFGGANFHVVLEQHIPGALTGNGKRSAIAVPLNVASPEVTMASEDSRSFPSASAFKAPLRGALVLGAKTAGELAQRLAAVLQDASRGRAPAPAPPGKEDLRAPERLAIDFTDAADLAQKAALASKALQNDDAAMWKALRAKGVFRGRGARGNLALLYTGQGSQYVNMLAVLRSTEPVVAETFAEADRVMTPLLGKPLSEFIFADPNNKEAVARTEEGLRQTAITQPAVLTADLALTRLLAAYGIEPDMTMGHSLGEYGALVAAGALPFADALEAVSARGREMTRVSLSDNGRMAAVFAPLAEIERLLKEIGGNVVIANINSTSQAVIGGASAAVEQAVQVFQQAGFTTIPLPVSHAFHTSIVAPASGPLRRTLERLQLRAPQLPVIANVNGEFYPANGNVVPEMLDILAHQVASPVQFVRGLHTLYAAGARAFVEVGPKKALHGFVEDVFAGHNDVTALYTNSPKDELAAFNQALCGLYAAGFGCDAEEAPVVVERATADGDRFQKLGRLFAEVLDRGSQILHGEAPAARAAEPVTITGAALGLPGTEHIFDDGNVGRILRGEQFIDAIPPNLRQAMMDKHITRLVKSDNGGPTFETISDVADSIKLAGRGRAFDLGEEFGVAADRLPALDRTTRLAIAAGLDALRDAGIPLRMRYRTTSKGTFLPDRWMLPDALRDDTGVIFGSAFPGYNALLEDVGRYYADRARNDRLKELQALRSAEANGHSRVSEQIERRIAELQSEIATSPYQFDRRFLFKTLSMGHSQFAEFIGARGPNTQINSACATTTQAVSLAEDWLRAGRCRRVVIVTADDVTSDQMLEWIGAGFLATGAAATDEIVEDAAIPFDRRRHGMLIGMGAAALVVETADAVRERGLAPICEVLATVTANSAFHATRLNIDHIGDMMEKLLAQAETSCGIDRHQIAPRTVFISHETYTPARGGSASAEIHALRRVFGDDADRIVIANTKGFTGHPMGTGIEDVVGVKALETGCVPPVANFKEVDPELGPLNLSRGGAYDVEYALRLAAGFGSQISMSLLRWVPTADRVRRPADGLGYAYRIADRDAWNGWLQSIAGRPSAEMEVVHRTLRIKDQRPGAAVVEMPQAKQAAPPPPVVPEPQPTPVVTPPAAAPPQVSPAIVSPAGPDSVRDAILALVVEKTGYAQDMLDLDLDLEADLGIDTVKQAELFAAVRERYHIPREENRKLRDYPTLAHVIRFVLEKRPDLAAAPAAPAAAAGIVPVPSAPAPQDEGEIKQQVLAVVAEKTGYPTDMLDLDLDLEADLGIDTVKQAEMFAAIRERYHIPREENRKLRDYPTLAHVIRFVLEKRPGAAPPPIATPVAEIQPVVTAAPPARNDEEIKRKVLAIVADKTGYPTDMLDLDLDLEADLGIDTVKQAEMFAAVRAEFAIPRQESLKLRDFPTLAHVIRFASGGKRPAVPPTAPAPQPPQAIAAPARPILVKPARPAVASFDAANRVPRRVPLPVLRPPLSLCKATGVNLPRGARVLIMPDAGSVAEALTTRLQAMGVEVVQLPRELTPAALGEHLRTIASTLPVSGIYWLPALDDEGDPAALDPQHWHEALHVRVKSLYFAMRFLYEQIAAPGTFLVSATRMGGQHGYDDAGASAPLGGAVSGFTKAYKRERPDATVKVVDFETRCEPATIAELLLQETLRDSGGVEIGYQQGLRWTVGLREQPAGDGRPGLTLNSETVFLITGAAGSIVSAITADLAAASGGVFYLLDVVPAPDPQNPDLARFVSDKEGLKRELFSRIQARGERATPALVEKELAALERSHAALSAIKAVRAAGGAAHYLSVNALDADAMAQAMEQIRPNHVDVLLHAAGLERSHFLPDKSPAEFDLVFDVKSDGWFNLLRALGDMPIGATVAFSSVAGRFGNAGQADYSAANDLLCKLTSNLRRTRPATRGIVIDWTAWGGIGMATRGSIPKMMEQAGIDMLPPEAGIPLIRRELTAGGTRGEIVIGERLGVLGNEWDDAGGLDVTAVAKSKELAAAGPMMGAIHCMGIHRPLTIETVLDPAQQPFLRDHQMDGTPVLPGVMGIEAFAEAAQSLLPGWRIAAVEDVSFSAPFKFYRNQPRALTVEALIHPTADGIAAECSLMGHRQLPNQREPQTTTHFTGRVLLTRAAAPDAVVRDPIAPGWAEIDNPDIYRLFFHGPAYRVLQHAWRDGERMCGQMARDLPPNHQPADRPLLVSPRFIELCFQTAGLWEMATQSRFGLPQFIRRLTLLRRADESAGPFYAVVTPDTKAGDFSAEVLDTAGHVYLQLSGYRTVALPAALDVAKLEPLRHIMTEVCDVLAV